MHKGILHKTAPLLSALLGLLLAAHAVRAGAATACTAYCEGSGANARNSGHICYLPGGNGMPATLARHCLNQPGVIRPVPLPVDLQQHLLTGRYDNPFRRQYPLPPGVTEPVFDRATLDRLQTLPLQLDGNNRTEEWLVYDSAPASAAPPWFWVIQYQGRDAYRIVLEHAGQMFWVEGERADGYHNLRTARFAQLDQDGKTGTFTDLREWRYTNGFYALLKTTGLASGAVEQPKPVRQ